MDKLKELTKWLNSPEGEEYINGYMNKYFREEDSIKSYFETEDFEQLFSKIVKRIEINDLVCDDHCDGICFDNVTDKQFYKLTSSIFLNKDYEKTCTEFGFPSEICVYRGIKFETIYGQGSFTTASKYNPDEFIYQI
jgi:hypothetical protein